jgi:hypothetical protein
MQQLETAWSAKGVAGARVTIAARLRVPKITDGRWLDGMCEAGG